MSTESQRVAGFGRLEDGSGMPVTAVRSVGIVRDLPPKEQP